MPMLRAAGNGSAALGGAGAVYKGRGRIRTQALAVPLNGKVGPVKAKDVYNHVGTARGPLRQGGS
jgi:hypothetical protein